MTCTLCTAGCLSYSIIKTNKFLYFPCRSVQHDQPITATGWAGRRPSSVAGAACAVWPATCEPREHDTRRARRALASRGACPAALSRRHGAPQQARACRAASASRCRAAEQSCGGLEGGGEGAQVRQAPHRAVHGLQRRSQAIQRAHGLLQPCDRARKKERKKERAHAALTRPVAPSRPPTAVQPPPPRDPCPRARESWVRVTPRDEGQGCRVSSAREKPSSSRAPRGGPYSAHRPLVQSSSLQVVDLVSL